MILQQAQTCLRDFSAIRAPRARSIVGEVHKPDKVLPSGRIACNSKENHEPHHFLYTLAAVHSRDGLFQSVNHGPYFKLDLTQSLILDEGEEGTE
jgi:hypothetical protein